MKLYLQMGHGMQNISKSLVKLWGGGDIVLSPVNMEQSKALIYAQSIRELNGKILFDPQLFSPRNGHAKLQQYDYWPQGTISDSSILNFINRKLLKLNIDLGCDKIILPGGSIDESNFTKIYSQIIKSADYFRIETDKKLLATICLKSGAVRNLQFIEEIIEPLKKIDVDGYYLILEPSKGEYINTDNMWAMGMIKLIACLKLQHREVLVGYSSHQNLLLSLAKVDGICSGTYANTRAFQPKRFQLQNDKEVMKKSIWYYLPDAFTEYKATFLDVAKQRNFLNYFEPQLNYKNNYSAMLFSGALPSSTNYNETNSFYHYLFCLRKQCELMTKPSYDETYSTYEFLLNCANNKIKQIKSKGISGQNRDFEPGIETNRIAMVALDEDYGLKLKLEWNNI
jgi:hypothetical protein